MKKDENQKTSFSEKEVPRKNYYSQANPPTEKAEPCFGESMTVPGMTMSIEEMLEYQRLGKPISATKGTYLGDLMLPDPKSLDIEDLAAMQRKVMDKKDRLRIISENYRKAKTAEAEYLKEVALREKILKDQKSSKGDD